MTHSRRGDPARYYTKLHRRVIGLCAVSHMRTHPSQGQLGKRTHVLLLEDLYVTPKWRGTRVGRCLLHTALTKPCRHGGTTRIACVARRHAPQQAAARHIYSKMGMRPRAPRRNLVDSTGKLVSVEPLYKGARDDREAYYECWYDRGVPVHCQDGLYHIPHEPMVAGDFIAQNRTFLRELKEHHARANGGGGADPYTVLAAAQHVFVAWCYDPVCD